VGSWRNTFSNSTPIDKRAGENERLFRNFRRWKLAGLVGETVTLRLLPEGGDNEADCYHRGEKVARLRVVERDGKLADSIKAARLDRARELILTGALTIETNIAVSQPSVDWTPTGRN